MRAGVFVEGVPRWDLYCLFLVVPFWAIPPLRRQGVRALYKAHSSLVLVAPFLSAFLTKSMGARESCFINCLITHISRFYILYKIFYSKLPPTLPSPARSTASGHLALAGGGGNMFFSVS